MISLVIALQDAGGMGAFESGWRSMAALVVVFGLLGLLAWLARRGSLPGGFVRKSATTMRVETALPLGDRRSLAIVVVEGRRLVIGMSPASVSLITELATPAFDRALQSSVDSHGGDRR